MFGRKYLFILSQNIFESLKYTYVYFANSNIFLLNINKYFLANIEINYLNKYFLINIESIIFLDLIYFFSKHKEFCRKN